MAKRKAASAASRRTAAGGSRARKVSRKSAKGGIRSTTKATTRAGRDAAAARKSSGARAGAGARKATARKAVARKSAAARKTAAPISARSAPTVPVRKAPRLSRARRTFQGEDIVPTPPSSLDLDRHASAARSGRKELRHRQNAITQTGPALTAGDVDADWESAYSVGDEAPGGDNPTPDQDVVDDIGKAVGVEYEDNEELKSEEKIIKRDRHRWELDPASSEDYNER